MEGTRSTNLNRPCGQPPSLRTIRSPGGKEKQEKEERGQRDARQHGGYY
jgi:hypothetical protein